MIELRPRETILLSTRRHWYVLIGPACLFAFLLIAPSIALNFLARAQAASAFESFQPLMTFFVSLYLAALLTAAMLVWINYSLDVWIITDQRVIAIQQHGLFRREISEIAMDRIQNVTVEIPGFIATLLDYGHIRIETAGEENFGIASVPHYNRAKDLILAYSQRSHAGAGV